MTKLRKLRLLNGLSMIELSARTGVSYSVLCRHELGWTRPSRKTADRLAAALRTAVADLFPDVDLKDSSGKVRRSIQPPTTRESGQSNDLRNIESSASAK